MGIHPSQAVRAGRRAKDHAIAADGNQFWPFDQVAAARHRNRDDRLIAEFLFKQYLLNTRGGRCQKLLGVKLVCGIAPILPTFLAENPGLNLDLRLSDTAVDLIDGGFDLALRNMVLEDSSLKGRKLADDTRILCASPAYLAQYGTPMSPDELGAHRLVGFKDQSPRQLCGPGGAEGRFDPRAAKSQLTVDDGLSQKIATLNGAGISINSMWSVHQDVAERRLIHVLPGWTLQARSALWLVYPKTNVLSAKVRVFMDFLLKHFKNGGPWDAPHG